MEAFGYFAVAVGGYAVMGLIVAFLVDCFVATRDGERYRLRGFVTTVLLWPFVAVGAVEYWIRWIFQPHRRGDRFFR